MEKMGISFWKITKKEGLFTNIASTWISPNHDKPNVFNKFLFIKSIGKPLFKRKDSIPLLHINGKRFQNTFPIIFPPACHCYSPLIYKYTIILKTQKNIPEVSNRLWDISDVNKAKIEFRWAMLSSISSIIVDAIILAYSKKKSNKSTTSAKPSNQDDENEREITSFHDGTFHVPAFLDFRKIDFDILLEIDKKYVIV